VVQNENFNIFLRCFHIFFADNRRHFKFGIQIYHSKTQPTNAKLSLKWAKKPSLEVAPTTFQLVLLIYSFQLISAFSARCRNWFFQFPSFMHFSDELSDLDLPNWHT